FDLAIAVGHARHTGRQAGIGRCRALAADGLRLEIGLEDRLIFRSERRFLARSPGLARIKPHRAADHPPLTLEVGIDRVVPRPSIRRPSAAHARAERQYHHNEGKSNSDRAWRSPPFRRSVTSSRSSSALLKVFLFAASAGSAESI